MSWRWPSEDVSAEIKRLQAALLEHAGHLDVLIAAAEIKSQDAEIGKQWREDSSLEKWFPFTALELARLRALERKPDAPSDEVCPNCGGTASCRCCEMCGAMTRESCTCCERCGGSGKVPTADHESYFGANYKPCPRCGQNVCPGEPPAS